MNTIKYYLLFILGSSLFCCNEESQLSKIETNDIKIKADKIKDLLVLDSNDKNLCKIKELEKGIKDKSKVVTRKSKYLANIAYNTLFRTCLDQWSIYAIRGLDTEDLPSFRFELYEDSEKKNPDQQYILENNIKTNFSEKAKQFLTYSFKDVSDSRCKCFPKLSNALLLKLNLPIENKWSYKLNGEYRVTRLISLLSAPIEVLKLKSESSNRVIYLKKNLENI